MSKNTEVKEVTVGQRIKEQRVRLGMTQDELAERMCIPKTTLSAYENDKIDFKASRLAELAKALYTTPDYLLGFEVGEKDESESMIETMVGLLRNIKDEKVLSILFKQIQVVVEMNDLCGCKCTSD